MMIGNGVVSVIKKEIYEYPKKENMFRPSYKYAEYPFEEISPEPNEVYDSVREALYKLDLDVEHYGTKEWNPLKDYVTMGDNVLIKPNLVMDFNQNPQGGTDCLYTQPAVVAAIIDYVIIALHGSGKIVIGDAPMQECKFEKLISESGYDKLVDYYKLKGYDIQLVDFRGLKSTVVGRVHKATVDSSVEYTEIDLGQESEFAGQNKAMAKRMRITNYDPRILNEHHDSIRNEYCISQYILNADVIINMPKPKSHRKAGATISLKNFVGANARKEYLPHHTMGAKSEGGDEYLKKNCLHFFCSKMFDVKNKYEAEGKYKRAAFAMCIAGLINRIFSKMVSDFSEGSWYGNDTISRTITDLNKIVYYADREGKMCDIPQRKLLIVADMIVSGEKEGPVCPSPKKVGIIAAGTNPVCFDKCIATLMGFDWKKIPTIVRAGNISSTKKLCDLNISPIIVSNDSALNNKSIGELDGMQLYHFEPTSGWKDHIELV